MNLPTSDFESFGSFVNSAGDSASGPIEDLSPPEGTAIVAVLPSSASTRKPDQLGPYRVGRELGRGAMGAVYEATHTRLKRKVALKLLPEILKANAAQRARFSREMEAVGRLDHPNIVRAMDAGEIDDVCYLTMELAVGLDLQQLLERVPRLEPATACEIVRQVACGLQHIHDHGLVHRDIKPSNLMLTGEATVRILDLGIAMLREPDTAQELTSIHALLGTPDYMAPEQVLCTWDVDIRADIYSLGCTLYTLLTGTTPFDATAYPTRMAKMLAQSRDVPPSITSRVADLPIALARIVERMLAKDADQRPQTPAEVARAMRPWADADHLRVLAEQQIGTPAPVLGRDERAEKPAGRGNLISRISARFRHSRSIALSLTAAGVLLTGLWCARPGVFSDKGTGYEYTRVQSEGDGSRNKAVSPVSQAARGFVPAGRPLVATPFPKVRSKSTRSCHRSVDPTRPVPWTDQRRPRSRRFRPP